MINFLHTFQPEPILVSLGPINIYWYGLLMVISILAAIFVALKLSAYYNIKKDQVIDLAFWLIIFGLIGARLYHVLLEFDFYIHNPLNIFKVWQGGLAIHGAIIAGVIVIYYFIKKYKINFWALASIIVPGLALGQAIGRWGNYFNQELFGLPTDKPWGIPINILNRPIEYISSEFFHPTFLYESIGSLVIFIILILIHKYLTKKKNNYKLPVLLYLILYSLLRFSLEFIRIDSTPEFLGLRWPQIVSVLIILISIFYMIFSLKKSPSYERDS